MALEYGPCPLKLKFYSFKNMNTAKDFFSLKNNQTEEVGA